MVKDRVTGEMYDARVKFDKFLNDPNTIEVLKRLKNRGFTMSIYQKNGYSGRTNYLSHLSEDYGIPVGDVMELADLLGPEEDFDGLLVALDDYNNFGEFA
jgi:hypothetical protein